MKRIAWGLAIVVGLLLVANAVMSWRTEARLNVMRRTVRAAGDPASIGDLKPAPIPAAQNAAAQIAGLGADLKTFGHDHIVFLERTPLGEAYDKREDRGSLPTAEQSAAMRAILLKNAAMGEGISRAAACDKWASVGDFSVDHKTFIDQLLTRIQDFRGVMRYAAWEIAVLAQEGKRDDAVRRGVDMLKLSRLEQSEPTLVSYLVAIAVRGVAIDGIVKTLASGPVSPETRGALDAELARCDDPHQFAAILRLERGIAFDALDEMAPQGANRVLLAMFGWSMKRLYVDSFESMGDVIQLADGPWADFRQQVLPWGHGKAQTGHGVLADLLAPAIAAAAAAQDRDITLVRSLRVLNALQAYAAEHGREASGLADLALPAEATTDSYSGKPLMLKRTDGAWTVYGVGKNGVDDGGKLDDEMTDVGLGPPADGKMAAAAAN